MLINYLVQCSVFSTLIVKNDIEDNFSVVIFFNLEKVKEKSSR